MKNLSGPLIRILLLVAAVAVGWGILSAFGFFRPDIAERIQNGQQALATGDVALAESTALAVLEDAPEQYEAWVIAGVAAVEREDFATAQKRFDEVPDDESAAAVRARLRSGEMQLNMVHRLSTAEDQFRRAYRQQKPPRVGVEQLALLLGIGGRYWEQGPFLLELIRDEKFNNLHLYLLQEGRTKPVNPDSIPMYMKTDPDDPVPQLGWATQKILVGDFGGAISGLRRIVDTHPEMIEAHAKLGLALLADGRREELVDWNRQLPKAAGNHPDIWVVRGALAELLDQSAAAIRCYWEAVRLDPNNVKSGLPLGRLLGKVAGETEAAGRFQQRAAKLIEFSAIIEDTHTNAKPENSRANAKLAESLGLMWEAFGWTHLALRVNISSASQRDHAELSRLRKITKDLPLVRTAPGSNPAEEFDLSEFPQPDWISAE